MSETNTKLDVKAQLGTIKGVLDTMVGDLGKMLELACHPEFDTGLRDRINDPDIYKPLSLILLELQQLASTELECWDVTKDMTRIQKADYYMGRIVDETRKGTKTFVPPKQPSCDLEAQYWNEIKDMTEKQKVEFFMKKALDLMQCSFDDTGDSSSDSTPYNNN
jgi:hypothetical protein